MPHFLSLQQVKTSSEVSVTSRCSCISVESQGRGVVWSKGVSSWFTGMVISILDAVLSQNRIIFWRVVVKLVQATSLTVEVWPSFICCYIFLEFLQVMQTISESCYQLPGKLKYWESLSGVGLSSVKYLVKYPLTCIWSCSLPICSPQARRNLWIQQQQKDTWVTNFFQTVAHLVRSGETKCRRQDAPANSWWLRSPSISWKRKLKHLISSEALVYSPSLFRCFLASHTKAHDPQPNVTFLSLPS